MSNLLQEASYRDVNRILLGLSISNLGGTQRKKKRKGEMFILGIACACGRLVVLVRTVLSH